MRSAGNLTNIFTGAQKGARKNAIVNVELIADYGVQGDHHAGRKPQRQVSLFAAETLREIAASGIVISPEELSTNLLTEGIALDLLMVGTKLQIGIAVVEITEARKPCGALTKIDRRLPRATYQRCGQFARVIKGGIIYVGDKIEIINQTAIINQ